MTRIIPAEVHFDKDGGEPPKLVISEGGSDLSELITDRGIEIKQESGDFMDNGSALDPHNHESEPSESLDLDEPEPKPPNGFRGCMSEQLRRPPESERLSQPEVRQRFRQAVLVCKSHQKETDQQNS